ncbi:conjugal transfer protein TraI [Emticicia sp. TH156]|uniref:conjugal transfer protein TraI n=1 Tax=Emticicia sp. TH156 TaxID=2067454 RepID=UPI000C764230|nr:conjugal transfer protein TraI [Emticicia sp. TH156]PLK44991.1 conjugal transfer protein TraI [Emticicia sp. TH156]
MRKYIKMLTLSLCLSLTLAPVGQTQAAIPAAIAKIIKAAVVKVIKAVDLMLQRLQNKTIWLQNAQKELENILSKMKLKEIADWTEKQKEQYRKYYEELTKVKSIIAYYQRIRDITQKQVRLVQEYNHAWGLFKQDKNFTASELEYMAKVYAGILEESLKNINRINLIIKSFTTQMADAKRLEIINHAADQVEKNYDALKLFNQQNKLLSLQRAKTQYDVEAIKKLYGLP